ncbi:transposase [Wielerella bovis]|uniref:transposase n=1 Tax=Wielerella bovis TaxID=2917790 RepID=UPI00201915BF|nr:transposase [Wielerella bovis]ULJ63320.1 transposase [Wielerella bovis]
MPTYAIIDSQSVKTAAVAQDKGFDGGKKIKGRKRHIAVDTMGNLLAVVVHAANIHDTKAGIFVAQKAFETYPSLKGFCADAAYCRTFEQNVQDELGLSVDISVKIKDVSWQVLPKRWIAERTFAWLGWSRRLAKDFEQTILSAENFIKLGVYFTNIKIYQIIIYEHRFLNLFLKEK